MLKKIKEKSLHFLVLAFFAGLFIGINISFLASATEPSHKYLDYFHRVYQLVKSEYVDVPVTKKLFYGAIRGMIHALDDPFTRFLDESSYKELREMTTGKFVGVGIEITVRNNEIVVVTPIEDSPAMKAGVLSGDIIKKVNDKAIKGMNLGDVVKMIKGLPKSSVVLYLKREGFDELIEIKVERAPVKIKSVNYGIIKKNNTGYLKIKNFGSDTTNDVNKALRYFNKNKIEKVVIDLRNNPGGLLTSSIEISNLILRKGMTIVSTRGREGSGRVKKFTSMNDPVYTGKMIVLVNRGSASAAEILSGAIRDNNRGKLLGEKTFGKGSVQKSYTLDENVGVAITIAKYYTPSGELIHKKGIKPDYEVPFEKLSKKDRDNIYIFNKRKLFDKFIKKNMVYTGQTRENFYEFLKNNDIKLSKRTADFILKRRIYRYKKKPLYDLEFDVQLQSALKKMK